MSRMLWAAALLMAAVAHTGCFIPIYSGDPTHRARQLIFSSEDFRQLVDEWERVWFVDQPSHLTPKRTHGGII